MKLTSHQPNIITLASRCHCRQHHDWPGKERETYKEKDGEREHKHIWGCFGRETEEREMEREIYKQRQYTTFTTVTGTNTVRMLKHTQYKDTHRDAHRHTATLQHTEKTTTTQAQRYEKRGQNQSADMTRQYQPEHNQTWVKLQTAWGIQ